jgi:hypothetical protein
MPRRVPALFAMLVSLLAAPTIARADIVFTNFGPSYLYDVTEGNSVGNGLNGSGNNYAEGETFTPTATYTLNTIRVALSSANNDNTNDDTLTVNLTVDAGDQPGAVLESFSIAPGTLGPLGSDNPPIVLTSLLNPTLTGGTQYWVTVSDAAGNDAIVWNLNNQGDSNDQATSTDGGSTWFAPTGNTPGAFEVDGTFVGAIAAPEPASLALLTSGAFAMIAGRWGFRRK